VIALEARKIPLPPANVPGGGRRLRTDGRFDRWWQAAISAVGLLLLSPVSLLIAAAVKLSSRGPILYRGERIGRDMKPFTIFKFRTLLIDAERKIGARLLTPGDSLYTPIGRFLKRTKLDEIPQLWNVVRGDMNLVGPRPIRPIFLPSSLKEIPNYGLRFLVRPGMTGLAQLRGGYFTHPKDKLRYDLVYMANRGMRLDVKLVLATFVKLLNRWLTLGLLLLLLFLTATFVPHAFSSPNDLAIGGFRLSPFEIAVVLGAGAILARQIPAHRFYLYRVPTNLPIVAFVLASVVAGLFSGEFWPHVRDAAYFTATGFVLMMLVVSGDLDRTFVRRAARVVALAAVAVAALGILQVVAGLRAGGIDADGTSIPRIGSTLGNPVVLSTYLVLGVPLVLVELWGAEGREERDFWLICVTLVVVGVLLSQTRVSMFALWIAATIFSSRVSRRACRAVVGGAFLFAALLVAGGGLRSSPHELMTDTLRRVEISRAVVVHELRDPEGLIGREPGVGAISTIAIPDPATGKIEVVPSANMHLTLVQRTGLLGWGLMLWVIGAALAAIRRGSHEIDDERLALTLWAIYSAGIGFLIAMANFNALYNPTIQVTFWGLLGVGLGIVTHFNTRRPTFNVVYRFGQGE
jgi:lipopolysaccharide/colanic/teichoic acid biosynthesis glycosyltransferase